MTATPSEIVVHAATKQEKKGDKDNVLWTEFGSKNVYRRFEVPNPINLDRVTANIENGLLHINAAQVSKPRRSPPRRHRDWDHPPAATPRDETAASRLCFLSLYRNASRPMRRDRAALD